MGCFFFGNKNQGGLCWTLRHSAPIFFKWSWIPKIHHFFQKKKHQFSTFQKGPGNGYWPKNFPKNKIMSGWSANTDFFEKFWDMAYKQTPFGEKNRDVPGDLKWTCYSLVRGHLIFKIPERSQRNARYICCSFFYTELNSGPFGDLSVAPPLQQSDGHLAGTNDNETQESDDGNKGYSQKKQEKWPPKMSTSIYRYTHYCLLSACINVVNQFVLCLIEWQKTCTALFVYVIIEHIRLSGKKMDTMTPSPSTHPKLLGFL